MPEIYLASSALIDEDFDGIRTIEEAKRAGFKGVQLFLDARYRDPDYRKKIASMMDGSGLGLVVHLPNVVEEEDKVAAEALAIDFPEGRFLIHYEPTVETPDMENVLIGWENSRIGPLSEEMKSHIDSVKGKVGDDNSFFVFDFGRMLYLEENMSKEAAVDFIRDEIKSLDPTKDVIHMTDKTSWTLRFRDSACVLGDGICAELLPDVMGYDGIVVFEYENLQRAIDSLSVIQNNA